MKRLIILIAVVDVLLAGLLAFAILNGRTDDARRRDELAQLINDDGSMTDEQRQDMYAQLAGDALRLVSVKSECTAKDGRADIYFANQAGNTCAAALELKRMDTNAVIAQTDLLDPGYYLESVQFMETLPAGEYECLAIFQFYWMENDIYVGSGARQMLLRVEE